MKEETRLVSDPEKRHATKKANRTGRYGKAGEPNGAVRQNGLLLTLTNGLVRRSGKKLTLTNRTGRYGKKALTLTKVGAAPWDSH